MRRTVAAVAIGLFGAFLLWTVGLGAEILGCGGGVDDYLPENTVFVMLIVVLVLNPALVRLAPRLVLDRKQLAMIFR